MHESSIRGSSKKWRCGKLHKWRTCNGNGALPNVKQARQSFRPHGSVWAMEPPAKATRFFGSFSFLIQRKLAIPCAKPCRLECYVFATIVAHPVHKSLVM